MHTLATSPTVSQNDSVAVPLPISSAAPAASYFDKPIALHQSSPRMNEGYGRAESMKEKTIKSQFPELMRIACCAAVGAVIGLAIGLAVANIPVVLGVFAGLGIGVGIFGFYRLVTFGVDSQ